MKTNMLKKIGMALAAIVLLALNVSCYSYGPGYGGPMMAPPSQQGFYRQSFQRPGLPPVAMTQFSESASFHHEAQGRFTNTDIVPGEQIDGPMDRKALQDPHAYLSGTRFQRDSKGFLTKGVCIGIIKGTGIRWTGSGFTTDTQGSEVLSISTVVQSMAEHHIVPLTSHGRGPNLTAAVKARIEQNARAAYESRNTGYGRPNPYN